MLSLADRLLDCFQLGAIMDKINMNILTKIFVWAYVFISPRQIPRSGIIRSYGK